MQPTQAFAKNKAKRRRNRFHLNIDLSALLAVMVVLLFILIFGPGFLPYHHPRITADLPVTQHATSQPSARREDEIRVSIKKDGSLYFRTQRVSPEDLPEMIRQAVRVGAERKVYVAADAHAKYGDVAGVVNQIRLSGIDNITFLTENGGQF
jgi:biopolymer transport protein ExbD